MTAMVRARPPANDGATDADCPSGSCMYIVTMTRR